MFQDLGCVCFTSCCRALTAGLSLTLNSTTNSTIPVSQPLSYVSLSSANLSLSLTSQISQWSSSIETTSSDKSVNRKLQVLNVSGFMKFKSKHSKFFTSRTYINPTTLEIHHAEVSARFVLRKSLCIDCVPPDVTMLYLSQSERRLAAKCSDDMS